MSLLIRISSHCCIGRITEHDKSEREYMIDYERISTYDRIFKEDRANEKGQSVVKGRNMSGNIHILIKVQSFHRPACFEFIN